MNAEAARWDRLATSLLEAGIAVTTTESGRSHHISFILPNGSMVAIHDKWWSKNLDKWIGWQVHVEDKNSIVRSTWPVSKKRSEIVQDVIAAKANNAATIRTV